MTDTEIVKEGFLGKKSFYLKQIRQRWMVLQEHYLSSFKTQQQSSLKPTEKIDLHKFNKIIKSNTNKETQFELISDSETRVFIAESIDDMNSWMNYIEVHLEPKPEIQSNIDDENKEEQENDEQVEHNDDNDDNDDDDDVGDDYDDDEHYDDDTKQNDAEVLEAEDVGSCNSINKCESLQRLIDILKCYKIYIDNNNDKLLSEYLMENKQYILNDYHHILSVHLDEESGEEFELLYNKMMDERNELRCDISTCQLYQRHNREREKNDSDLKYYRDIMIYIDLIESIHCHFIHSVDTGFRIIHIQNKCRTDEFQVADLKGYLREKQRKLTKGTGTIRRRCKFITDGKQKVYQQNEDMKSEENTQCKDDVYSFGERYNYWTDDEKQLHPKYDSVKEEIISNDIHVLDANVFNNAYRKAKYLINDSDYIRSIDCKFNHATDYGKYKGSVLNIDNVISMTLFTDYEVLAYNLTKTFRENEERNKEYGNWTKILIQTVNCFGTKMQDSKIKVLYHGASLIYFNKFVAQFNAPTSATTKLQIAAIFANNDGIMLELSEHDETKYEYLRYFDCSFLSEYGYENERLFFQPPCSNWGFLKFVGIWNMKTSEDYTHYLNAFIKFREIICSDHSGLNDKHSKSNKNLQQNDIDSINKLIVYGTSEIDDFDESKNGPPHYISECFERWRNSINNIEIDCNLATKINIWDKDKKDIMRYDKINEIFTECRSITCRNSLAMIDELYVESLLKILKCVDQLNYSKLTCIKMEDVKMMVNVEYLTIFAQNGWKLYQYYSDYKESLNDWKMKKQPCLRFDKIV